MNKCKICKKELTDIQVKRKNKTCSRECAGKLYSQDRSIIINCLQCKKEFKVIKAKKDRKFCSWECANEFNFKGKPKSEEECYKNHLAQHNLNKQKDCECEKCGKRFDKWTSLRAHKAHCGKRKEKFTCEKCDKVFYGYSSFNLHLQHCENRYNPEWGKKGRINSSKFCDTDIEIIIEDKLLKHKVKYEKQRQFVWKDFYHACDFYLPEYNLVIECDGDYWHGFDDVKKRDRLVNKTIKKIFKEKVIRFDGSIIKKYPNKVFKEIMYYGKNKKHKKNRLSKRI